MKVRILKKFDTFFCQYLSSKRWYYFEYSEGIRKSFTNLQDAKVYIEENKPSTYRVSREEIIYEGEV